jgi:hypothetical protein
VTRESKKVLFFLKIYNAKHQVIVIDEFISWLLCGPKSAHNLQWPFCRNFYGAPVKLVTL